MCCSVGQAECRDGSYTASYTRQDCGLGLVTTEYQGYEKCASPLSAYSHSGASPSQRICSLAGGSGAPFPLQQARQLTKRSCFCVFPQPCVALQKYFLAIFVHKAGLRELRDHKQFVSSVLRTFPNTWAFQPLQWRTSQPSPPPIYSHNSKILSPLPTSSSLKLSESREPALGTCFFLKEAATSCCSSPHRSEMWKAATIPNPFSCTHTLTF